MAVQPQSVKVLEKDPTVKVEISPTVLHDILYLDTGAPPFDDPDVRRAFNLAVDREALLQASYFGLGEVARQPLPKAHWAHEPSLDDSFRRNVGEARALLAKAGHANGLTVRMLLYPTTADVRRGEIVKAQVAEAGINLELVPTELTQAVQDYFNRRKHPMFLSSWTGRPDPASTYTLLFGGKGYYNAGHVDTPALNAAVERANAVSDVPGRQPALAEAAEDIAGDMVLEAKVTGSTAEDGRTLIPTRHAECPHAPGTCNGG